MITKLSLKNISKSFKDYAIYFFTLILGVAIFYVFNAIDSQTVMMDVSASTREIIKLMTNMLSGVSVFVSFILGFLIIYASRFLIKRRNKEFGIYLILGMSKRKISLILFLETLFIGIISLVVGLLIGSCLSQLMSLLVANMFEADLTNFSFVFSKSAALKTLLYFGIMYLVVMLFNVINISRCKLIDLINGAKKSEKIKLKNPYICTLVFIVACIMLGYAYFEVTVKADTLTAGEIFVPIILGSISTFLIFWSLSGLIIRIVMSMKKLYYKGLNSFIIRNFCSKINTTVFSMTIICLMLFITICVLSSSLSIKNSMTENLKTLAPMDIELSKTINIPEDNLEFSTEQKIDSRFSVRETLANLDFDVNTYFTDILEFNVYATNDLTISDTLGAYLEIAKESYPFLMYDTAELMLKLSDYNKIAEAFNLDKITLNSNEYAIIADFDQWIMIRNEALKENTPITINNKTYYPKYNECINGFIEMTSNHINIGIIVLPDESLTDDLIEENYLIANYKSNDKDTTEQMIMDLNNHPYAKNTTLEGSTKISIYEASVGLGALVTFIGLYLGIIFLISSAAILALKELSESSDNAYKFNMLRKLGVDDAMLNKALFKQIAIFFLFPLVLAIIHSIFGIIFCDYILATFGDEKLLASIIMTAIFIVIIYGGYFLITYICSKNIIRE